jgi:biopolymer transport protein ExbB
MDRLVQESIAIWLSGGWAMIALAADAVLMFAIGINLWIKYKTSGVRSVPDSQWRRWIDNPRERRGAIGDVINFVVDASTLKELDQRFQEISTTSVAPYTRDLRLMKRCVNTAPLLGLLGTVTGMLTTFSALASGAGGEKTMDLVAGGISEALITTQTGLVIAVPGLFFQYHLARERERYKAFLSHLQTVCAQRLYRRRRVSG